MTTPPTIGRIVHFVPPLGFRPYEENPESREIPAIITRTWGEGATAVQLTPFPDLANDKPIEPEHCSSVAYDATTKKPRTWHWPHE